MIPTHTPKKKTPFIKVCGQTHPATVDCAAAYGARFVGFIFHSKSPRCISPERAAQIPSNNVKRVGVFVRQGAEEILPIMQRARLDFAQLHGKQSTDVAKIIGPQRIIRVLWPEQAESAEALQAEIDAWAPYCAYYLLDAGSAGHGGTGRRMQVSRFNELSFPHPWILAVGLNAENIAEALNECSPDGVDLNSGVELAPGMKAPDKMLEVFTALSRSC